MRRLSWLLIDRETTARCRLRETRPCGLVEEYVRTEQPLSIFFFCRLFYCCCTATVGFLKEGGVVQICCALD
ncbi:hypothetical protein DPEC_G00223620 [Dallia pectoralis]|uniref:Uncharacterized protein n=1 Tax=Dallia pectoralis TaxID=75939 RepID=A0ACC2G0A0_DALPE|nr:hypothetical protein DPEC_G00223620 [Dallia pectoralis]